MKHCPFCGWPEHELYDEASQHRTAQGQTVWTRCVCGSLQMRVVDAHGSRVVSRGRPEIPLAQQAPADCR